VCDLTLLQYSDMVKKKGREYAIRKMQAQIKRTKHKQKAARPLLERKADGKYTTTGAARAAAA